RATGPCPAPPEGAPACPAEEAGAGPRLSVGVEYLFWWLREGRMPASLTTSSQASQGLFGQPDTSTLYGNDRGGARHGDQSGGVRLTLGYRLADGLGIEARGFFLERDSTHFRADSDGSLLLAVPYLCPDGRPTSEIVAGRSPAGLRSGGFVGYSRIE